MATTVDQEQSARMALASLYSIVPVSFTAIGMQLFMCCYGLIVFKETPISLRKSRRPYVVCSWVILLLFTICETADAAEIFVLLADSKSSVEAVKVVRPKVEFTWWRIATTACLWFGNWMGDGLLVWRCFHVWFEHQWVACIPTAIFCGSCVASIMALVYRMLWMVKPERGPQLYGQALQAWIFLSVAVNIIVTALISFRLLRIRRQLANVLSPQDLQIYLGVVAILIESALPLSLAGIAYAILAPPSSSGAKTVARTTALLCWFSLNALCPQMIIFRVLTGRSWLSKPTSAGPRSSATVRFEMSTAMHFADPDNLRSIRDEEQLDTKDSVSTTKRVPLDFHGDKEVARHRCTCSAHP